MKNPIKVMWFAVVFNSLVAVMNFGFLVSRIAAANYWGALVSVCLICLNSWSAWFIYGRLRQFEVAQKQRVMDILSGKFG